MSQVEQVQVEETEYIATTGHTGDSYTLNINTESVENGDRGKFQGAQNVAAGQRVEAISMFQLVGHVPVDVG